MNALSELRNRDFYRRTLHIMLPVLLQQLITVGINFFDNIMVGSFGEAQIAGASLANEFYSIFQFVCMGLGSGAIVLSAQFWGARERHKLRATAAIALRFTVVLAVVFTAVTVAVPDAILRIYTNDEVVVRAGMVYMRLLGCTFLLSGLTSSSTYLLRSVGHTRVPLIGSVVAFVLNLFFNWVFIFGKLGMPRLEIVGAAVGTLIARIVECAVIFGYFLFRDEIFGFRLRHFLQSGGELIRTYLRFSLPVLISDTMLGVGISLISVIIGHIGADFVAAHAIVATASRLLAVLNIGMAGASAVIIGNTVGEGDRDRAYREGLAYVILAALIGCGITALLLLLAEPYLAIYSVGAETLASARSFFLYEAIMMPIQMVAYVTSKGILRGGGDTRFLMFGDIALLWLVSLPLGYLAGFVWHMAPFWIYFFLKLEYAGKGIVCAARFISRRWIRRVS